MRPAWIPFYLRSSLNNRMKSLFHLLLLGLIGLGSPIASICQSKARITITREQNGQTQVESREFILEEGQDIDGLLREMGVMNEFGELRPGQRFEIQMEKSEGGTPDLLNRFEINPRVFEGSPFGQSPRKERQAYLGVTVKDALVPGKTDKAARITEVAEGSPAAKAKLAEGDLITHIQKARVETASDLVMRIQSQSPGDDLLVEFIRGGKKKKVRVELGERLVETKRRHRANQPMNPGITPFLNQDGFELKQTAFLGVTPGKRDETTGRGVLVGSVLPGSCADEAGVLAGDLILKFNGTDVAEFDELAELVRASEPGSKAEILVRRQGRDRLLFGTLGSKPSSNKEDFRIFHDFRGLDDEGQFLFDFELDMDQFDLGSQFNDMMRKFNDDIRQMFENPMFSQDSQQMKLSIEILEITPEELAQLNQQTDQPIAGSNDLIPETLTIYPNPGNGLLRIELSLPEKGDLKLRLLSGKGTVVFEETRQDFSGKFSRDIDFSSHADGTYFLHITQNGRSFTRKVVKGS